MVLQTILCLAGLSHPAGASKRTWLQFQRQRQYPRDIVSLAGSALHYLAVWKQSPLHLDYRCDTDGGQTW